MYSIARTSDSERKAFFDSVAFKIGINSALVEKDFWVCLTLDYLFSKSRWKDAFTFKGGHEFIKGL
jgi:hypothetical protein